MGTPRDINIVKQNLTTMIDKGAPEEDVDAYMAEEGYTPETFKAAMSTPQSSYIGDVAKNAWEEVKGLQKIAQAPIDLMTGGLTGMIRGEGNTFARAGQTMLSPLIGVGRVIGGLAQNFGHDADVPGYIGNYKMTPEQMAKEEALKQNPNYIKNNEALTSAMKPYLKPVDSFREAPLSTTAAWLPVAMKGASMAKGAVSDMAFPEGYSGAMEAKVPPTSVFNKIMEKKVLSKRDIPGAYRGLREPVQLSEVASKGYVGARFKLSDAFGEQIGAFEKSNGGKLADITEPLSPYVTSQDPAVVSAINKSPQLKELISGIADGQPAKLTITKLQDLKNSITTRINKNKLAGELRPGDIELMELVDDLNESMLSQFPEAKPLYDRFSPYKKALDSAKGLRNPESAYNFITSEANPVKIKSAVQILDPELANAIKWHKRIGSWGIPTKGGTFQVKAIAKNPWGYKQMSTEELARKSAIAKIASRVKD